MFIAFIPPVLVLLRVSMCVCVGMFVPLCVTCVPAWFIAANHAFRRRRAHKISCLKGGISCVCSIFGYLFGHKSHTDTRVREVVVRQPMCGVHVDLNPA
jgi:hypothetical protein